MDSKHLADDPPTKCSTPNSDRKYLNRSSNRCPTDQGSTPRSLWPLVNTTPQYGSIALPIYLFDCNISGLTSNILFKDKIEKPKNYYQNHLFKHESNGATVAANVQSKLREELGAGRTGSGVEVNSCDHHEFGQGHMDRYVLSIQFKFQFIFIVSLKGADLNRYTFHSMFSNEKIYLFKSAPFIYYLVLLGYYIHEENCLQRNQTKMSHHPNDLFQVICPCSLQESST